MPRAIRATRWIRVATITPTTSAITVAIMALDNVAARWPPFSAPARQ